MANTKQSIKRAAQNKSRAERNKAKLSLKRSTMKAYNNATEEERENAYKAALSVLDRSARQGIIHKNRAKRKKAQLMREYNAK